MVNDICDRVECLEHKYNVSFSSTYDLVLFEGGKLIFRDLRKFRFAFSHSVYYFKACDVIDRYYRLNNFKNRLGAE